MSTRSSVKLTKRAVDLLELPQDKLGAITWDDELKGFGIRVMPSGTKTYILNYRTPQRKQRRIAIGRHGVLAPDEARKRARQMLNKIADNRDPLEEQTKVRGEITFEALAKEYISRHASRMKSGYEEERIIRRELIPRLGRRLACEIRRGEAIAVAEDIRDHAAIVANRALSVLRRIYNFGIDRELVEINPASRLKPLTQEISRDRVLSAEEIRTFWNAIDEYPSSPQTRQALRLIIATGQRPGEVVTAEWTEIVEDEDGAWWTIPAEKAKNGLAHRVPLSLIALEILHTLPHAEAGFVFLSPVKPGESITGHALSHFLARERKQIGIERFTPHDLRRTAASHMASMQISRLVISKILNHVETGITAVYDRHSYDAEKRAALEAWGVKLADILEGKKTRILSIAGKGRRG